MALAALAPLLGGIIAPSAFSAMGLTMPGMLASAIGSGLGGWAATGNPVSGLEDAAGGALASGLGGMLNGGGGAANAAATGSASGAAAGGANGATNALTSMTGGAAATPLATVADTATPDLNAQIAASMSGGAGGGAAATPGALSNLGGLNFNVGGNYAAGAAPASGGGMLGNAGAWAMAHPLTAGVGGLALLSALGGKAKTPADPTYTSPGLTPYVNRTAVAPPAGFQPGISPEPYYFTNPAGFADGGPVVANPYQTSAPGMVDLQLGLNPSQIVQRQLMQQTLQPAERYAAGGSIPQLPKPQMSVDNRGMSMLQREAMRSAMPYPHPAMAMPSAHMAMPHAVSASIGKNPLGMAMGGGVPGGIGGAGGLPGMQVPDIAGDGSSDSIPATIDGQSPAMLSSGEHIIPADAVSALGNGSTDAGSKQLHAMTNRIRMAKTGSAKMPNRINPRKVMPA